MKGTSKAVPGPASPESPTVGTALSILRAQNSYVVMRKTAIRVDISAARAAAEVLHTKTLTETVNAALREVADRRRRLALFDDLASGEGYDFGVVEDAWH